MREDKLFEGDTALVSTFEFHKDRERAPHLEQPVHQGRLEKAAQFVGIASQVIGGNRPLSVIDLGCGDGGLLQLLRTIPRVQARGYDFQPSNVFGWVERGVEADPMDFVEHWDEVPFADVYVLTEVLEHLTDPHNLLSRIWERGAMVVASSPYTEHAGSHDECHAWAWDILGYRQMFVNVGFDHLEHALIMPMFQVWLFAPIGR